MNCPKCGTAFEPGKLYCSKCGEEYKLVPEFDPEIENSINEIMNDVLDSIEPTQEIVPEVIESENFARRRKLNLIALLGIGFLVILFGLFSWGFFTSYRLTSYEYQIKKAKAKVSEGALEEAIPFYQRALEIRKNDTNAVFALANVYLALGEEENALLLYKEVVANDLEETTIREKACGNIVDMYVNREDYRALSDFLSAVGENEITNNFAQYRCPVPTFSYQEGTYDIPVPLKLTSDSSGNIYYTIDGTVPDEGSEIYSTPIFLENGDYSVSAFFVNSFGVKSDVVTKIYHVVVTEPTAPEVLTYSGDYTVPTMIEVDVLEGCNVYYTTDGSTPDASSILYNGPIPMPIGKSEFKFIMLNAQGLSGEITTRSFDLELQTQVSVEQAEKAIHDGMMEAGKIYTEDGLSYEIFGRYLYLYQYVTHIEDAGDFYIIGEVMEDENKVRTRTGALYAVDIYSGKRFFLSLDDNNAYVFHEF